MGQTSVQVFSNVGVIWQQRSCLRSDRTQTRSRCAQRLTDPSLCRQFGGEPAEATQHQLSG